jgi:hypothetical protein
MRIGIATLEGRGKRSAAFRLFAIILPGLKTGYKF